MVIEKQIYELEGRYLESTRDFGNIFIGWDKIVEGSTDRSKKRKTIANEERCVISSVYIDIVLILLSDSFLCHPPTLLHRAKNLPKKRSLID